MHPGSWTCAESSHGFDRCHSAESLEDAAQLCSSLGARLCSTYELEEDVAHGTGCNLDINRVWSSTLCHDGAYTGHITQAGSRASMNVRPRECGARPDDRWGVRCCADAISLLEQQSSADLAPSALSSESSTCTSVNVSWFAPRGAYPERGFALYWTASTNQGFTPAEPQDFAQPEHAQISRLLPGSEYDVWVAALTPSGPGRLSKKLRVRTQLTGAVPDMARPPTLLGSPDCTSLSFQLPEQRQAGCRSDAVVTLQYGSGAEPSSTTEVRGSHSEAAVHGLGVDAYSFRTVAINQAGQGSPSAFVGPYAVGMLHEHLDGQPQVSATSSHTVSIDWSTLTGPCHGGAIIAWRVAFRTRPNSASPSGWKVLEAAHRGTTSRASIACHEGCSFK
eukprot:2356325-Prymnesium_polylepis.1